MDDALGAGDLALGREEHGDVVVGLLDEVFGGGIFEEACVEGTGDDLVGAGALDEEGVEEDVGAEVFEAVG